jgi:plastocyanin
MRPDVRARAPRARITAALVTAIFLAAMAAGCSAGSTADSSPVATTTVDLPRSYRFAPSAITVEVGATVTWTNNDNFTHNVDLAEDAEAPLGMAPGESVSHEFPTPGTFAYVCSLHPNDMTGTVLVTGG